MNGKKITNILLILSVCIFLFGSGFKLGEYASSRSDTSNTASQVRKERVDLSLFWDTWDKLEQKFVDKKKLDSKKMFYGAIKGMVASIEDPYTFFLTPEENKQSKDDLGGKFEGIGAQLGLKDNRIVIVSVLKESPAEKTGKILSGDYINKIDGQSTRTLTLVQVVTKIRGPKGSKVKITFERKGQEFDVEIVRNQIVVKSVELSYEHLTTCEKNCQNVAYLKLNQFGENTNDEWDSAVDEIKTKWNEKSIKGLVLDVRDNPGGYLDSAVYLASEFIPQGKVVVKQESATSENKVYTVSRVGQLIDIPIVVLINKGSASASEILAGALRDQKKAELIGEKTFGKGSVQEALDLKEGAGIHITVAKWILPNGDWINGKGIAPDIQVTNEIKEGNTLTRGQDKQLEKAVEEVLK